MLIKLEKEEEFNSFLRNNREKKVLIKFFTTWCVPCRQVQEVLKDLLKEKPDLLVLEVDAEKFPILAESFQVLSVPTLLLFHQGKMVKKLSKIMNITDMKKEIY